MPEQNLRETIRVQDGKTPLLERHLARLKAGGCSDEVIEEVRTTASTAATEWPMDYCRMSVTVTTDDVVQATMRPTKSSIDVEGNPVAHTIKTATPSLPQGAAKPANRTFWDQALGKVAMKGAHVAIMVDDEGNIIDGSQATVWVRFGDTLATPPAPPALAGISRAVILDEAESLGYSVEERPVSTEEYESADEAFLSTAVGGVRSVRGREGEAAEKLGALFDRIFGIAE